MVGILGDPVDPAEPVMGLHIVDALRGPGGEVTEAPIDEIAQTLLVALPQHVVPQEVAIAVVPGGEAGGLELQGVVTVEAPGLGDEHDGWLDALERGLDLPKHLSSDELRQIEAEPVHVVGLHQVHQAVDDETPPHGGLAAQVVAAAAPVGEVARRVEPEVIQAVPGRRHEPGGGSPDPPRVSDDARPGGSDRGQGIGV